LWPGPSTYFGRTGLRSAGPPGQEPADDRHGAPTRLASAAFTGFARDRAAIDRSDLVSKMAEQLKLTTPEFRRLVECSLTGEGLLVLLANRGEL
jgi:hypothetical protein